MTSLMAVLGLMGIIQGLGMKYNKTIRKKLMLDAEGVDKKYVNFKISFLIITGSILLLTEMATYFNAALGEKMQILLSAFLLLSITSDIIYKRVKRRKL
jgi:uncharacterized Tic20 family protein